MLALLKVCKKCGETKHVSEFYVHPGTRYRESRCYECKLKRSRENWKKNREHYDRRDSSPRRKRQKECHRLVHSAINEGTLVVAPCERCGNVEAEAHHEDYRKPLDVKWLCRKDHRKRHIEMKRDGIDPFARQE